MATFKVFCAVVWFVNVLAFGVSYLYDERLDGHGWFVIVSAIVFTTLKLIEEAIDAVDGVIDRGPQI